MLTHEEHQAMIMFDRLLMMAKDNETVADLLDQTLNVARMIDPKPDEKISYGPLQRMHFEWQQLRFQMNELNKKMDNYINSQNRYGVPPSTWPSNPGLQPTIGYPQTTTSGTSGYHTAYSPTFSIGASGDVGIGPPNISPLTIEDIKRMGFDAVRAAQEKAQKQVEVDTQLERLKEQLNNISTTISNSPSAQEAK